ncbi:MAG: diguanylate cyclase [Algicola sp.]|nr:diguanylate cyclase [Algicola sp.]
MKRWLVLLILLYLPTHSYGAQVGQLLFEQLDVQKLPNNAITRLAQDNRGFIWIGTQSGLLRFDGYDYQANFTANSAAHSILSSSYIRALMVDDSNRVWIGTMNDGLFIYDNQKDILSHYQHNPSDPDSLADNRVEAITSDGHGGVWLGTYGGLHHFTLGKPFKHFTHDKSDPTSLNHDRIRTLLVDHQDNLWIGTWQGLDRLAKNSTAFEHIDTKLSPGLTGQQVYRLFQASDQQIWIGTYEQGINVYQPQTGLFRQVLAGTGANQLSHPLSSAFAEPTKGQVWVGSFGGGIDVLDGKTLTVLRKIQSNPLLRSSISNNSIGSLLVDSTNLVWVGTWGHGLNTHNANNLAFKTLRHSTSTDKTQGVLNYPDIFSVLQVDKQLWIGTRGRGVTILDASLSYPIDIPQLAALNDKQVKSLYQDDNGTIWLGTIAHGLYRYSTQTAQLKHYTISDGLPHNLIGVITSDVQGVLWLGTAAGLTKLDPNTDEMTTYSHQKNDPQSIASNSISTLAFDHHGTLWIGTYEGLNAFDTKTGKSVTVLHDPNQADSLSHNHINTLLIDSKKRLWVATAKDINLMTHWNGKQARFDSVNKLTRQPTGWRENLLEDNLGRIWSMVDSKSLLMVEPNKWQAKAFSRPDGVGIGNTWAGAYAKDRDGQLFYGGTQGLLRINPERVSTQQFSAPIRFTKLYIDGKRVSTKRLKKRLTLQPEDKGFTLEFAALDYFSPNSLDYKYRLLGFNDQWTTTDAGHRQISYTNLAPGDYQLQVFSVNAKGHELSSVEQRLITVLPKFWQTMAFKILMLGLLVLLVHLLLRWRTYNLNQQALALRALVKVRTSELETLAHISRELNATLDIDNISLRLHQHISNSLSAHVFALATIDHQTGKLHFGNVIENNQQLATFDIDLTDKSHLAIVCISEGKTLVLNKREDAIAYLGELSQPMAGSKMQSVLYQPLKAHDGKVIGCITVQDFKANAYSDSNVELLGTLASYTAIALDNAQAYRALENVSNTDYLTNLPNRRAFFETAKTQVAHSKRNLSPFAVALADIDHFKSFNDNYGHDAGDYVLQEVSRLMKQTIREQDSVARWGGEEFIFLLPDTHIEGALIVADKIRQVIEMASFSYEDQQFNVRMTFGLTIFTPGEDLMNCINRADALLYQGKEAGRNRVVGDAS